MYCAACGREIENTVKYCPYCGAKVKRVTEQIGNTPNSEQQIRPQPHSDMVQKPQKEMDASDDFIRCLIRILALVISILLWFFAPYIAVDLFTFYQQPTAFQVVTNQVFYWGSLLESTAFWASAACLVTIALGLATITNKKHPAAHICSIIAELLMLVAFIENVSWMMKGLEGFLGVGYWGQVVLFLIIIIT